MCLTQVIFNYMKFLFVSRIITKNNVHGFIENKIIILKCSTTLVHFMKSINNFIISS